MTCRIVAPPPAYYYMPERPFFFESRQNNAAAHSQVKSSQVVGLHYEVGISVRYEKVVSGKNILESVEGYNQCYETK